MISIIIIFYGGTHRITSLKKTDKHRKKSNQQKVSLWNSICPCSVCKNFKENSNSSIISLETSPLVFAASKTISAFFFCKDNSSVNNMTQQAEGLSDPPEYQLFQLIDYIIGPPATGHRLIPHKLVLLCHT